MSKEQETRIGNLETLLQLPALFPHLPLVEKMAFQNSADAYSCGHCGEPYPYFKMVTSYRLEHLRIHYDEDIEGERHRLRICANCELDARKREWAHKDDEEKGKLGDDWCTLQGVRLYIKKENKGALYSQHVESIKKAKTEMALEDHSASSASEIRHLVIKRAMALGRAFINELQKGGMMNAFAAAGTRMNLAAEKYDRYHIIVEKLEEDPQNHDLMREADDLEKEAWTAHDYQCMAEKGSQQAEYLKSLDFLDYITPGMRIYNCCRAKTGDWNDMLQKQECCGLAFPAKLWEQPNPQRWKYKCNVKWESLIKAALHDKDKELETEVTKMMDTMVSRHGQDPAAWPKVGCGARFIPWAKGESMVVELRTEVGYEAFVADRIPPILDDEIKKNHAAFYNAAAKLTAADLLDDLPMSFPVTHTLPGIPCVARFPVDKWDRAGNPKITGVKWCKIAQKVAEGDLTNLQGLFDLATDLESKL